MGLLLDTESRTAALGDKPLHLTRLEFDLLYLLLRNSGRVLSREQLLEDAWGYDFAGDTRAVDSAVKRLRSKLRTVGDDQTSWEDANLIESVRGIGYRFKRS